MMGNGKTRTAASRQYVRQAGIVTAFCPSPQLPTVRTPGHRGPILTALNNPHPSGYNRDQRRQLRRMGYAT